MLEIIFATLSTLSVLSLGLYIYLFCTESNVIHQIFDENGWKYLLPIHHKIMTVFAIIGLFVAMYNVCNACLYWIPSDWGSVDEYGEYTTFRNMISSIFSLFATIGLLKPLECYEEHIRKRKYFWTIDEGYRNLLDCIEGNKNFVFLKNDYQKKLSKAQEKFQKESKQYSFSTDYLYQEFWEIKAYNSILKEIENFQK